MEGVTSEHYEKKHREKRSATETTAGCAAPVVRNKMKAAAAGHQNSSFYNGNIANTYTRVA